MAGPGSTKTAQAATPCAPPAPKRSMRRMLVGAIASCRFRCWMVARLGRARRTGVDERGDLAGGGGAADDACREASCARGGARGAFGGQAASAYGDRQAGREAGFTYAAAGVVATRAIFCYRACVAAITREKHRDDGSTLLWAGGELLGSIEPASAGLCFPRDRVGRALSLTAIPATQAECAVIARGMCSVVSS